MLQKVKREYPRLRNAARDESCVICGVEDGTVVLAHRNMPGDFGRGLKGPDWFGAHLCAACHREGDSARRKDYQWWEVAVYRTLRRLFQQGHLEVRHGS